MTSKVAISLDHSLLRKLDRLVKHRVFASRSQAIQSAVREKLDKIERGRLSRECALLDPKSERALAEEGLVGDAEKWPEY
jgi:metal-responsive CopG/Arc/MetJ family transcriptional regulator